MKMKSIIRTFLIIALGQCLFSNIALAQSISIEQCYDMARANYPLLKKYDLINLSEKYNLKIAAHAYIPQFSINGKATYQNETIEFPFDVPPIMGDIPDFSKDQYQVAVEMTQILWDGGATTSKRKSARAEAQSSREELEVDMYALRSRINNLYFGILLLQEQLALNDIMSEQLRDNATRVLKCIDNGVASSSDYDIIDVELISNNQRRVQMETMQNAYVDMLSMMVGSKISADALIKPRSEDKTPEQVISDLALANTLRPELRLFDAKIHEIQVQEDMLYTYVMPRLGLFVKGMYGRPSLNMMSNDFKLNAIGGVSLTWNFGALYNLRSGKELFKTNKKSVEAMRETFLFNNNLQTRSQYAQSDKYIKLIEDDDRIISLRSRICESMEAALGNGVKNAADLIQELTKEQVARQQKAVHEIELLKAVYELKDIKNQ